MSFVRKNEAHAWICREQLKRKDLCRQAVCWLLYRLYKALLETENRKAAKERFQYKKLSPSRFNDTMPARQAENANLLKQIGNEYNLSKATIRNYVHFGTQLDQLEEMFPGTRIRILKGELDVPIMFMDALMQMPREDLGKMIADPQCQKLVPPKEIVTEIRKARDGYYPSVDDILYHLEQLESERYNLNLGNITSEEGEPIDEFGDEFVQHDDDPFGADLPDDIYELRQLAESLTGRLRAVYEAMLQRMADGSDRMTLADVQHEWGVSYNQIMKDVRKIKKLIRERIRYK